jgi:hypothetical protein
MDISLLANGQTGAWVRHEPLQHLLNKAPIESEDNTRTPRSHSANADSVCGSSKTLSASPLLDLQATLQHAFVDRLKAVVYTYAKMTQVKLHR